jgi:hypothetical protein
MQFESKIKIIKKGKRLQEHYIVEVQKEGNIFT